jgi:hypothetical protein
MIVESLIAGTAFVIYASLKYTDRIVNGDKRAERKWQAEEAEKDRLNAIAIVETGNREREKELALIEKERQAAEKEAERIREEEFRFDPAMCKAKRLAIAEKRKLINFERDRYISCYDSTPNKDDRTSSWWKSIVRLNGALVNLAEEESRIPVLDGMETFDAQMKALEKKEQELKALANKRPAKDEEEVNKYKVSVKEDALERERAIMEKILVNAEYSDERDAARVRLKEITTELGKL